MLTLHTHTRTHARTHARTHTHTHTHFFLVLPWKNHCECPWHWRLASSQQAALVFTANNWIHLLEVRPQCRIVLVVNVLSDYKKM